MDFRARVEWVNNLDFAAGQRALNQVYLVDVTYALDAMIGAGERTSRPWVVAAQGRR